MSKVRPKSADQILTRREAAAFLRISVFTLDSYIRQADGPIFFRSGERGRRFFLLSDLQAFVAERRARHEQAA